MGFYLTNPVLGWIDGTEVAFNAGVTIWDLDRWQTNNLTDHVQGWMRANLKTPLYRLATNPLMLLAVYRRWLHLPEEWNFKSLGGSKKFMKEKTLAKREYGAYHYNGKLKPWLKNTDGSDRILETARYWRRYHVA